MTFTATIITLYPKMFPGPLGVSLAGRARAGGGIGRCDGKPPKDETMKHDGLIALGFIAMAVVLFGVPILLGLWRQFGSKWGAIALSTFISPFLMLGALKLVSSVYWELNRDPSGGGCAGGECGPGMMAAGYWPLLIPVFMVPSFLISMLFILAIRSARK